MASDLSKAAAPGVAVEAIRDLLDTIHAGRFVPLANSEGLCKSVLDNAEDALTALLAGAAGGQAEPAKWQVLIGAHWVDCLEFDYKRYMERGELVRQLYAHPPVPVRAPQVTDEQIDHALAETLDALAKHYKMDHAMHVRTDIAEHGKLRRDFARAILALAATPPSAAPAEPTPVLQKFNELMGDDKESPLERLRFFCSLAMNGQDWLDVEPFFAALEPGEVQVDAARPASMSLETMIAVNALRNVLAAQPTAGNYELCYLDTPLSEVGAYVQKCVDVSGGDKFQLIKALRADGVQVDVAHYGNGPTSNVNGAWACAASPDNIRKVLDALRAVQANFDSLQPPAGQQDSDHLPDAGNMIRRGQQDRGEAKKYRDLLVEWLEGMYDSSDFLRRVKLACGTGVKLVGAPATSGEAPKRELKAGDTLTFDPLPVVMVAGEATAAQGEKRCEYCDGTGDVHRADGEWLGACTCPLGAPSPAAPGNGEGS
jgi:hypothetical protein